MTARALQELSCNCTGAKHAPAARCAQSTLAWGSRAWKARYEVLDTGWRHRRVQGPRGGQHEVDFCPDCVRSCEPAKKILDDPDPLPRVEKAPS